MYSNILQANSCIKHILTLNCLHYLLEYNICEIIYDQYEKYVYHIINMKDIEWGAFPKGPIYHNTSFNPKQKK